MDQSVRDNLKTFIGKLFFLSCVLYGLCIISGHLELYLMDVDPSDETRTKLRNIELVCDTDLEGSTLLRDLHILVVRFCILFCMHVTHEDVKSY